LTITPISINERTSIRTIVKWSRTAVILAVVIVLLVVGVFVKTAHANSIAQVEQSLSESQSKISEINTQLEDVKSEKLKLSDEVKLKDEKIQQLEKENSDLKE